MLQPLWEMGQRTAHDAAPLSEVVAWVWSLLRPAAAHATAIVDVGPELTLPSPQPLALLLDDASPSPRAPVSSPFAAALEHTVAVAAANTSPARATTSLTGTLTIFGPKDYVRSRGTPVPVTDTISVPAPLAAATLRIDNHGLRGQYAPVTSAVVTLNATVVVAPDEFKPQVTVIEKPVPLLS